MRSVVNNFEFALKQVKPGFVIALGGDDGLLPNGIQGMCDILLQTGMELLAWPAPAFYYPNTRGISGQLCLYRESGIKIIDSNYFLAQQAKNLSISPSSYENISLLPKKSKNMFKGTPYDKLYDFDQKKYGGTVKRSFKKTR